MIVPMPQSVPPVPPTVNHLLAALPPTELERVTAGARYEELAAGEAVHRANEPHLAALFPVRGLLRVMALMPDGESVQVAAVGRRGVVGISRLLGVPASPFDVVAGDGSAAYRVPIESVLWSMRRDSEVTAVLLRYVQSRIVALAQGSACHRMHSLDQRAARWLLETSDELDSEIVQTTHEFMADLLGVQRPRLSEALERLRKRGTSSPERGMIVVSDRELLERSACSCYWLLRTYASGIVDAGVPRPEPALASLG